MKILVTGGAGFIGSHLCDALVARNDQVVCLDNLSTGRMSNIAHLLGHPGFRFVEADLAEDVEVTPAVDVVFHLASPASPPDYQARPLETLSVGSLGTKHALRVAHRDGARFVLASTSEVYGDPAVHPQPEDYWGHVNPVGPRSMYDEAKRFAEALTAAYRRTLGVNTGIVRIFNTYGPRMKASDGRVVTNFITQALNGEALTLYGEGTQTRSFCYVDDLVRGLLAMADTAAPGPLNLGNPEELTIETFARLVLEITGSRSVVDHRPLPVDDPARRCPVIDRAWETLGWRPSVPAAEGLRRTVEWFRSVPGEVRAASRGDERLEPAGNASSAL
ncbi:UDP-glucuronic acid decarboxylase family protein [Streptomyces sp. NPDC001536]|uniref:UDP-glucuronic acid decarboxylase family protein n=1 Tax=Streptomyces sp. NPDC001536 TaxID=3364583 RepID=UPI0036A38974